MVINLQEYRKNKTKKQKRKISENLPEEENKSFTLEITFQTDLAKKELKQMFYNLFH